ncbi:MAG: peptidoglycan DD-metalloendopeptidase family protein [Pseudomonadales bacterium]|jgi:murein DD-endopeptidase MepM/ murein hydrolase activator NlpD|nr:peptidoglycan DD-metalloendopeptidase family protein [Pseudomonadales bacterium]MDP7313345.1 peptidoglycan DD-metalloendopeptidase family protein [Pseudomonadales bacterium]MDP7577017.1 peptidoglycan DD-metalloendopeptidase family protein [Pseudomonadales bacterium]HJP52456.1 peptidoglycan DD-metalloendopeptidase family protein [Pseudomonadales bacterium]|tara:strand:+ start:249 stop:1571 length:1323 start_codon:yes stop_codon:yes gene_type:complete
MHKYPQSNLRFAAILTLGLLLLTGLLPETQPDSVNSAPVSLSIETIADETIAEIAPTPTRPADRRWEEAHIQPGDSLSMIFQRAGFSAAELQEIMSLGKKVAVLGNIKPGQSLRFEMGPDGDLKTLLYEQTPLKKLTVSRSDNGFDLNWDFLEPEVLISYKSAKITEDKPSLYHAGKAVGLSDNLIMELSYVFQWDISFALDLRQGDTFTLLYEDIYVNGEKVREGQILAAEFNNFGKTYTAVLFEENGRSSYFTPEGRSMRKAFLRDPVHFSHVSSRFNMKRLHPIHKRVMPHRGIDYAANRGTPVLASGDGTVTIARQNSASGRYMVIRHGEKYETKYLHLSSFAKSIRPGKKVKQGQTIGYVGATGWATAPHLHYEFLVNGVHRNPRTVKLPKAEPISKSNLLKFKQLTRPFLAHLESVVGSTRYASAPKIGSGSFE